jgi:hypothetical protein
MKTNTSTLLLAGLVAALSVGCAATPPTVGDKMIAQSKDTRDLGKQWQNGKDLVARGERIKADGMDIIATGDAKVKEGERLIAEGNKMMSESEMIYKSRFPGQSLDPSKQ